MVRFMMKGFLLVAIMFLSVLFGMQLANDGIIRMRGFDDPTLENAVNINQQQEELQVSLLGNDIDSHDLEKKKEQLQEMKSYNFFSSLGKSLADSVSYVTESIIDGVYQVIKSEDS